MCLKSFLVLGLLPHLLSARMLRTRQGVSCSFSVTASAEDTCQSFVTSWGLTLANFESFNPGIDCPTLVAGQSYCVIGTVSSSSIISTTSPEPTTRTPTSTTTVTTTTSALPSPTQPGLVANCDKFYLVSSGDQCNIIEAKFGISATQFAAWNPYIDAQCDNLWLDYYVCVHAPNATPTTTSATPTPTGPQPQMPGIVSNCKTFHLVQSGDNCYSIDTAVGITLATFLSWNTIVDSACDNLWPGYYVCVGV